MGYNSPSMNLDDYNLVDIHNGKTNKLEITSFFASVFSQGAEAFMITLSNSTPCYLGDVTTLTY